VVIDETGQGHAVLTIRTEDGDLILDTRADAVLRLDEVAYAFIKRESSHAMAVPEPRGSHRSGCHVAIGAL
jgi:predicted transglutaminase-like cysteine proteinase